MSKAFIDGCECTLLARVRPASAPYKDQHKGDVVGIDYSNALGGGQNNERLTFEQANAMFLALKIHLAHRGLTVTIGKGADGKLRIEQRDNRVAHKPQPCAEDILRDIVSAADAPEWCNDGLETVPASIMERARNFVSQATGIRSSAA